MAPKARGATARPTTTLSNPNAQIGTRKLEKKTLTTALPVNGKLRGSGEAPPAVTTSVKLSQKEMELGKKMKLLQKQLEDAAKKKDDLEWELAEEKANNAKMARNARKAQERETALKTRTLNGAGAAEEAHVRCFASPEPQTKS